MNALPVSSTKPATRSLRGARRLLLPAFVVALGLSYQLPASAAPIAGSTGGDDPATPPKAPTPTYTYVKSAEGFDWKAGPRMEGWASAWRPQTWPEKAWPAVQVYDPAYVNPTSFAIKVQGCVNKADFDLNMANKDAVNTYSWTFNGATQTGKRCVRDLTFAAQGIFPVKMEVKDPKGTVLLSKTRDVRVRDLLIVVLGDSMSSGEGSPDVPVTAGAKARWVDPQCHRSRWAPGALAAKAIEDMDPTTSVTFLSFACSGATIDKTWPLEGKTFDAYEKEDGTKSKGSGILGWYLGIESPSSSGNSWDMPKYLAENGKGVPSQIQQLKHALNGRKIDTVIMSAGINDAGFSRMLATCVLFKECPSEVIGYNNKEMPLSKRFAQDAAAVTASYERLGKELAPLTKRTLVFEYPNAFTGDDGKTCEYTLADVQYPFAITRDESNWIQTTAEQALHGAIRAGVQKANFEYVGGVWNHFKGHGYCSSSSKRWVRRAEESTKVQGPSETKNTQGTIHPNPNGYTELSKFIVKGLTDPGENTRPVTVADTFATVTGSGPLQIPSARGVLANDTSPVLTANLKVVNHSQPNGGKGSKAQINADGSLVYTPGPGFQGSESLIYTISDGRNEAIGRATFTVSVPLSAGSAPATPVVVVGGLAPIGKPVFKRP